MIAEDYFKNHPDQLDRYDLILEDHIASKSLCGDFNEDFLEHKIYQDTLSSLVNITRKNYFYRYEKNGILNVIIKELDHCETIKDEFIKRLTNKKTSPIRTTLPKVSKKPFPKQKKDLKILFLSKYLGDRYASFANLGLNIKSYVDNNDAMSDYVVRDLGKYDIIVAPETYSGNILKLVEETKKQQERSGQLLTMLCSYDMNYGYLGYQGYSKFPNEFELNYSMVGSDTVDQRITFRAKSDSYQESNQNLLEGILDIYNAELRKINQRGLRDADFKSINQMEQEMQKIVDRAIKEDQIYDKACTTYDELVKAIKNLINHNITNFDNIVINCNSNKTGAEIDVLYNGMKIGGTVISFMPNQNSNVKVIGIQKLNNKGRLAPLENVTLNIQLFSCLTYEVLKTLPRKATLDEVLAFNGIAEKVIAKNESLDKNNSYKRKRRKR